MSTTTETAITTADIVFHPVALDADGRPQYKFGKQLKKLAAVKDLTIGELRWEKSKQGIWSVKLTRSGRIMEQIELGKKRDLRDPRMMQMLLDQHTLLLALAAQAEADAEAAAKAKAEAKAADEAETTEVSNDAEVPAAA